MAFIHSITNISPVHDGCLDAFNGYLRLVQKSKMYNNWENTPDWVMFVAKDSDGGWYGYEVAPEKIKLVAIGQVMGITFSCIEPLKRKIGISH